MSVTSRLFRCLVVTLPLLLLAGPSALAQDKKPKVEVVGIAVTKADPDNEYGGSAVPGRMPGTEITVLISSDDLSIVGVAEDDDETTLEIQDESGKALENEGHFGSLAFRSNISEDKHSISVPVSASSVPGKGTTGLKVSGKVVLVTASGENTAETKFAAAAGTEVTLGNIPAKIEELEKDPYGEPGLMISFQSSKSFDTLGEITFLTDSGEELDSNSAGGGSFGFNDNMTYQQNYMIEGASPDSLTVRVRYFESTENVEVEIDLPVTLGLEK